MKNVNYADMANNLLGDELYYKFITEIAKESENLLRKRSYRNIL